MNTVIETIHCHICEDEKTITVGYFDELEEVQCSCQIGFEIDYRD